MVVNISKINVLVEYALFSIDLVWRFVTGLTNLAESGSTHLAFCQVQRRASALDLWLSLCIGLAGNIRQAGHHLVRFQNSRSRPVKCDS